MPRVLWTRCLPSMLLLTRPLRWHSASLCTWLWSLFTEGAVFFMFRFLLTMCSQTRKHWLVLLISVWPPIDANNQHLYKPSKKSLKLIGKAKKENSGSDTMVCFPQGWCSKRGKGLCNASTEEQASPSACRELWRPAQGFVQHALLPGSPPLTWPHPLCQDCASGQGLHERGAKL